MVKGNFLLMPSAKPPKRKPARRRKELRPLAKPQYPAELNTILDSLRKSKELITKNPHILKAAGGKRIGLLVKTSILPILTKASKGQEITLEEAKKAERAVRLFLASVGETILRDALKKASYARKLLVIKRSGIPARRDDFENMLKEIDDFMLKVSRREATLEDALKILEICKDAEKIG